MENQENAQESLVIANKTIAKAATRDTKGKHWMFTVQNWTEENFVYLKSLGTHQEIAHLILGKEVASTGTPHLQCFVSLRSRKYRKFILDLFGVHQVPSFCSVCVYVPGSIKYCKKDGNFFEAGAAIPSKQGKRKELDYFKHEVKLKIKAGETVTMEWVRENHSAVAAKYASFVVKYIADQYVNDEVTPHELRDWQKDLKEILDGEINTREIIFIVDETGNAGKTWFGRWYTSTQEAGTAQVLCPGKKADMTYTLLERPRVIIVDAPRSKQGEYLQYDFLEECKNGYIFTGKYESRFKKFPTPHIAVMMNEYPDMTKLSADRYHIITV